MRSLPQNRSRTQETPSRQRSSVLVAIALACLVLLPLLGHRPLTDWDEGIYAEIAREMLRGGSRAWLVPHWNGHPWFEKPPLLFWITAVSLKLFGLNAFAARLPSALAGVTLVGVLHAWTQRRLNTLSAWLGTVLLLSAFGFQHAARAGETDTLLSLGCLVAVLGLAEVQDTHSTRGWLWFWAGFALALMTKGAASVVLPLTAVLLFALRRRWPPLGQGFVWGLLLFLALVLPWHLALLHLYGRGFVAEYLGLHVLSRATLQIEGHTTHAWFYLWVLLVSAPPFALLYPVGIVEAFRQPRFYRLQALAVFAAVEIAFFSAVQTRLPHYVDPVYPAGSALVGAWLATWFGGLSRRALAGGIALLAVAYGISAAITADPRRALHSPRMGNGLLNPDNRESVTLLQHTYATARRVQGPLLVLRSGPIIPLQTDAFYARRLAQPVSLGAPPSGPQSPYYGSPMPLDDALAPSQSRLVLLDRSLLPALPPTDAWHPLETGSTEQVGILQRPALTPPGPPRTAGNVEWP